MIPQQLLCIRNVKIRATEWNSDGQKLASAYAQAQSATNSSGSYVSGGGGFSLGFFSIGGSASHSSTSDTSNGSGNGGMRASDSYGWSFKDGLLEIRGTQIIAWLSEIVPPCAPIDDPSVA